MIKWTKIDIGDGEAIWYSDCLNYHINRDITPIGKSYISLYGDSKSNKWLSSFYLASAKQWCEEHKKNHSQIACS